jgi:hypothetical protein
MIMIHLFIFFALFFIQKTQNGLKLANPLCEQIIFCIKCTHHSVNHLILTIFLLNIVFFLKLIKRLYSLFISP